MLKQDNPSYCVVSESLQRVGNYSRYQLMQHEARDQKIVVMLRIFRRANIETDQIAQHNRGRLVFSRAQSIRIILLSALATMGFVRQSWNASLIERPLRVIKTRKIFTNECAPLVIFGTRISKMILPYSNKRDWRHQNCNGGFKGKLFSFFPFLEAVESQ